MLSKQRKRKLLFALVPPLASFLLKLIYFSCKVRFHGKSLPKQNTIFLVWHGEMLLSPFCYNHFSHRGFTNTIITSTHFDGRLVGKIIADLGGATTLQGSSSKGGAKALIASMRLLKKQNNNIFIAPDGPRGPRHEVAQGAVVLSQKLNIPIATVSVKPSRAWEFNSWDKMILPKPFSRIDFYMGEPFYLDGLSLEEGKVKTKEKLMENAYV